MKPPKTKFFRPTWLKIKDIKLSEMRNQIVSNPTNFKINLIARSHGSVLKAGKFQIFKMFIKKVAKIISFSISIYIKFEVFVFLLEKDT